MLLHFLNYFKFISIHFYSFYLFFIDSLLLSINLKWLGFIRNTCVINVNVSLILPTFSNSLFFHNVGGFSPRVSRVRRAGSWIITDSYEILECIVVHPGQHYYYSLWSQTSCFRKRNSRSDSHHPWRSFIHQFSSNIGWCITCGNSAHVFSS